MSGAIESGGSVVKTNDACRKELEKNSQAKIESSYSVYLIQVVQGSQVEDRTGNSQHK